VKLEPQLFHQVIFSFKTKQKNSKIKNLKRDFTVKGQNSNNFLSTVEGRGGIQGKKTG